MGRPTPIYQDGLFYKGIWSRENERKVLSSFDYLSWSQKWVDGNPAERAAYLFNVRKDLRAHKGLQLEQIDLEFKIAEWDVRFHNFKDLLAWPGVQFDENCNKVKTKDYVWNEIAASRPDLCVYMNEGEANWSTLNMLFESVIEITSDVPPGVTSTSRRRLHIDLLSDGEDTC